MSLLLMGIFSALIFLYLPLLRNWFRSDDTYLMWASASLSLHDIFFNPERHRLLSSNFNPMYGVSFKIDWVLFQMNPVGYAVHCILSMLATSTVLFFFLRLYADKESALIGVFLFMVSPITLQMTGLFFRRHYMEGLFWALLGLYSFVKADRKEKASIFAAICYLISSLYREVYVVLPAIAFLISRQSTILRRLRNTAPLWAGLVIYALWRLWIREGMGGYPSNQPFFSLETVRFIPKMVTALSLQWSHDFPVLMYILLSVLVFSSWRYPGFLLCIPVLIIPILPVSNIIAADPYEVKYFFHITVFLIICISLLIDKPPVKSNLLFRSVLISLCFIFTLVFIKQDFQIIQSMLDQSSSAKKTATEFVYSGKTFIKSEQPSWFYAGLRNINRDFFGKTIKTQLVPPDNFLRYSAPERLEDMRDAGIDIPYAEILKRQKDFRDGPIDIRMNLDNYELSWDFGPHKDRTYTALRSSVSGLYYNSSELRSTGKYVLAEGSAAGAQETTYIRVLYRSDEGEEVISPEFGLRIPSIQKIEYHKR